MSARLNPYISFQDTAKPAMEFYRQVFGGDLHMMTFGELGASPESDPEAGKIMHAMLEAPDDFILMASDTPSTMNYTPGNTMSVAISGDDSDRLHGYWDRLSKDGTVTMPLDKQSWGDEFGMCVDRFGVSWMVDIGRPA